MTESPKAGLIDNGLYVSGVGLGSIILADNLRKIFGRDRTIGERIDGVLKGFLAGVLTAGAGSGLINQQPISQQAHHMINGAMWGVALLG